MKMTIFHCCLLSFCTSLILLIIIISSSLALVLVSLIVVFCLLREQNFIFIIKIISFLVNNNYKLELDKVVVVFSSFFEYEIKFYFE
jgi:hypothetical protein